MILFFFPVFVGSFLSFLAHRQHFLFSLLSLEAMMLALVVSLLVSTSLMISNLTLIVVFVFAVCEASLGLGVLVSMSRQSGAEMSLF